MEHTMFYFFNTHNLRINMAVLQPWKKERGKAHLVDGG